MLVWPPGFRQLLLFAFICILPPLVANSATTSFQISKSDTGLKIALGNQAIADYVWNDEKLPRPYFRQLTTPDGITVSRNYPPDPVIDKGNDDHPYFHPGAWMAFGDISGTDFWRNKARVRHLRLEGKPDASEKLAAFTVVNAWETNDAPPRVLCEEISAYKFTRHESGYILSVNTTFRPSNDAIAFGDQEEMGFGVRVATPLSVRHSGGHILNSAGGKQEAGTWGKVADWCAGFGTVGDRIAGIAVMASPENFRPSWFHSRNYGLIVANPFGKKAMTGPSDDKVSPDSTPVPADGALRLRFGVYVFSGAGDVPPDFDAVYRSYTAGRS